MSPGDAHLDTGTSRAEWRRHGAAPRSPALTPPRAADHAAAGRVMPGSPRLLATARAAADGIAVTRRRCRIRPASRPAATPTHGDRHRAAAPPPLSAAPSPGRLPFMSPEQCPGPRMCEEPRSTPIHSPLLPFFILVLSTPQTTRTSMHPLPDATDCPAMPMHLRLSPHALVKAMHARSRSTCTGGPRPGSSAPARRFVVVLGNRPWHRTWRCSRTTSARVLPRCTTM